MMVRPDLDGFYSRAGLSGYAPDDTRVPTAWQLAPQQVLVTPYTVKRLLILKGLRRWHRVGNIANNTWKQNCKKLIANELDFQTK